MHGCRVTGREEGYVVKTAKWEAGLGFTPKAGRLDAAAPDKSRRVDPDFWHRKQPKRDADCG